MGTFIADRPPVMLPTTPEVRDGLRDLSSGNPDPALLSDLGRVLQDSSGPTILYGDRSVDEKLEESGARLLAVDGVSADHLTVVSGGLDGMERVLQAHLRRGDRVAIEDPGYPAVIDLTGALGYVAVPMAMDDEGPQPDSLVTALKRGIAAVIVTPAPRTRSGAPSPRRVPPISDRCWAVSPMYS